MHSRLLSNAAPSMIAFAARVGQQVSSTNTGGLPGPAQIARLPVCIAAFTTIGPPVTSSRRTDSFLQMRVERIQRRLLDDARDVFNARLAVNRLVVSAHGHGRASRRARMRVEHDGISGGDRC